MENTPSCKYFRSLADEYIEGELTDAQMNELEAHIAECENCRRELDELKALKNALRSTQAEVPEGLHEQIMSAIKAEPKKKPARRHVFYRGAAISAACFMLCISFVVILSMMPFWSSGTGGADLPEDPMFASTDAARTEIAVDKEEVTPSAPADVFVEEAESIADELPIDTAPAEITLPEIVKPEMEAPGVPEGTTAETIKVSAESDASAETTKRYFKGVTNAAPEIQFDVLSPEAEASSAPGGEEITMALLVVSGLLAVASFVAFLISLSSVRNSSQKKDHEE